MLKVLTALRARLIDDARLWWRFWSLRLQAAGVALLSVTEPLTQSLNALPADVRGMVPWLPYLGGALVVAGMLARLIKQKGKPDAE